MLAANRHRIILELLQSDGFVKVSDLSQRLQVTEKTIREDLEKLEQNQWLKRIHGGAVFVESSEQPGFALKLPNTLNPTEKEQIAEHAVKRFIHPNDIIALDSGSTTLEIAKRLGDMPLTVLTNDLLIIGELIPRENIRLVVPGGYRQHNLLVQYNPVDWVKDLNIHKFFLSATGVHPDYGLSIFSSDQFAIKQTLMQTSKEIICVCDHSKFGRAALHTFAGIGDIDCYVTDAGLGSDLLEQMKRVGANVEIAKAV